MKNIYFFFVFLFLTTFALAQQDLKPCGTEPYRSPWLDHYQRNEVQYRTGADSTLFVPLTIHIVGTNNGGGFLSTSSVFKALCTLNKDYEGTGIRFFVKDEFNYIKNSDFYNHEDHIDGGKIMLQNNIPETVNCYIVKDPAGNCGYNLPWAGIALAKACIGPNDHTWGHELGHNFSLPHPFLGWEGGQTHDGSVPPVYNAAAPEFVTYNYTGFKDQLYEDTLIIDTAYVEKVDGSNCYLAADQFCDTKPDYLAYRWECEASDSLSLVTQLDPNGVAFRSQGHWTMSYSYDECVLGFSDEQVAAMRARIIDAKPYRIDIDFADYELDVSKVSLTSPADEGQVNYGSAYFEWSPLNGVEYYIFQVSRLKDFSLKVVDTILVDNYAHVSSLKNNKNYYWRVFPVNKFDFCVNYSETYKFSTNDMVGNENLDVNRSINIFPTMLTNSSMVHIELDTKKENISIAILDMIGREVLKDSFKNKNFIDLNPKFYSSGIYILKLEVDGKKYYKKLMIVPRI